MKPSIMGDRVYKNFAIQLAERSNLGFPVCNLRIRRTVFEP